MTMKTSEAVKIINQAMPEIDADIERIRKESQHRMMRIAFEAGYKERERNHNWQMALEHFEACFK